MDYKKLFTLLMVGLLTVSFSSAAFVSKEKPVINTPLVSVADKKPVVNNPIIPPVDDDVVVIPKRKGSSIKTKWVYDGSSCVKADVLSRPFVIGSNSRYLLPHVVVGDSIFGGVIVQRVFSGEKATAINDADCDTSVVITEPLPFGWNSKR